MTDTAPSLPIAAEAWAQFRNGLARYLRGWLPSEADAEDVLQDVFLRIHEGERAERPERLEAWVFGIARRAVADFYRARGRRPDGAPAEAAAAPGVESDEAGVNERRGDHDVHEEVLSWLLPMVEALPEGYREAVRLADVEGQTQQAVADRLGLSLSGAKSRVQRGRALLGDLLRACCAVEFGPDGRAVEYRAHVRPCEGDCG